jgi:hypothetical protein
MNLLSAHDLDKPNTARPRLRLVPCRPEIKRLYEHGELTSSGRRFCEALDIFCGPCDHKDECDRALEGKRDEKRWELILYRRNGFCNLILDSGLSLPQVFRQMQAVYPKAVIAHIARVRSW